MPRVFISHSSKDQGFVEKELVPTLHAHGIDTWYSTAHIRSAREWETAIREALHACDWFLVVLSP
ncbi:MAG: toll/interleukin-1 receptor domain-containing protein, partial [Planctomycetota bacterium]